MHEAAGASAEARTALPSGTVSFLFSDIEDSTHKWEVHRDAMPAAVKQHDAMMRSAILAHRGYVFKTIGDAFCAAFATAPDAVAAALDAQRALAAEDFSAIDGLKVRMALHAGHADERDGDYFGTAVNRVARLLAIGYGGQVLVSGAAADLAMGEMPPQSSLRDLGAHRLKDLTQPEQVYQLVAPDLQQKFFPLRSLDALPNNLPVQLTALVGRDGDVAHVKELLLKHRLVTLVGTGGVGKTRLSLQVAADVLDRYPDGVWFVELAPLSDPTLVPGVVASLFGVDQHPGRPLVESLVAYLKAKQTLLVFDNCEHLVAAAATTIDAILRGCPGVAVVASSREGLDIAGEKVLRVPSLSVPEHTAGLRAEDARRHAAVVLFADRAEAANESFSLTDANAATVASICRRLDGIAFAIELAAVRVKVLTPDELLARLNERFRILTGGSRTAMPRQQTMRALIDWSYDLLSENEQTLVRRLGVFAGGCTLDAASKVCAHAPIESWEVLDLLSLLVDKSMVVAELSGSEARYRLLESTRQYVLEKLTESGEREPMQRAHAEYFLAFAERAEARWSQTPTRAWLAPLEVELDNIRAALDWALGERRDPVLGTSLAGALGDFWNLEAPAEAYARLSGALRLEGELPVPTAALLRLAAAKVCNALTISRESKEHAERARERYAELGDRRRFGEACEALGWALARLGDTAKAARCADEVEAIYGEIGDARLINYGLNLRRRILQAGEDFVATRDIEMKILRAARVQGDERLAATMLLNLAENELNAGGSAERVLEYAREGLQLYRSLRHVNGISVQLVNIAAYLIHFERYDEARGAVREAVKATGEAQARFHRSIAVQHAAALAAATGDARVAARLAGFADEAYRASGQVLEPTEARERKLLEERLRAALPNDERSSLLAEGAALTDDEAAEEALRV